MKLPSPRHVVTSPAGRVLIATAMAWLLAFFYCRGRYWRDPHSAFFRSETVYEQQYSKYRASQAQAFIEHAATDTSLAKVKGTPEVCAAFVTVKRETTQYVDNAVASVMEGLTAGEREKLFLYVLFADTEAGRHPSWEQPWLANSVDLAVGYNVSEDVMKDLKEWEEKKEWYKKGLFDYLYALEFCQSTNASYTIMFEDDVIVATGWMAKVRQSLYQINEGAAANPSLRNWLYLRLFYTETALSWETHADYWYGHMAYTFLLASFVGASLLIALRCLIPRTQRHLDDPAIFVLSAVTIPAFVALAFMIGKYSLFPLRGVVTMNVHGCCTQALLFPEEQIPSLVAHLRGIGAGQTDTMIEDYADQTKKQRLAMGKQVVQHVGLESSRGNNFVNGQSTFAFWFEEYDPKRLEREHQDLLNMGFG
ncbi:hypothetical protein N431DRAFT_427493 [Stipitochalara longipes BDJ]|nr:hypothetical protein N431DRAFT_427493 [Stipitochalara longipes BDJ]